MCYLVEMQLFARPRPSGQLLWPCAGSRTNAGESLTQRSNCRPPRCCQNVREVPVVTDTTCRLHSICFVATRTDELSQRPCSTPERSALGSSAHTFAKRVRTFKNISHVLTLPCSRSVKTRSINSSEKAHDLHPPSHPPSAPPERLYSRDFGRSVSTRGFSVTL